VCGSDMLARVAAATAAVHRQRTPSENLTGKRTDMTSEHDPILRLRQEGLATRTFDEETIILDLRTSNYLALNDAGSLLWRRLELGASRSTLVDALLDEYETTSDQAARDVDHFLGCCRERNLLIEVRDP